MKKVDAKVLMEYVKDKWNNKVCPYCGKGPWIISENIMELRDFTEGRTIIGNNVIMPVLPITCQNCGHIVFINAYLSGIVKPPKSKEQEDE